MLSRPIEAPWRRAYEVLAAVSWAVAACLMAALGYASRLPVNLAMVAAAFASLIAVLRFCQALRNWRLRASLRGRALEFVPFSQLSEMTRQPDQMYLGLGFEWGPRHVQRLYDLKRMDHKDVALPRILARLMRPTITPLPEGAKGQGWIHGLEMRERPVYRPLKTFEGGTLLVGTTQSGKGVALATLVAQAIRRGDAVIVIDPKNSDRLYSIVEQACRLYRRPDTLLYFHPAFPEKSVRLDPLYNWQKATELASRIQSIMPAGSDSAFSAFGWDAVNVVAQGLVALEDRPNLTKLRRYIEGGIEPILERTLPAFLQEHLGPTWLEHPQLSALLTACRKNEHRRPSEQTTPELMAYVLFYERHVPAGSHRPAIDSQVRVFRHNRDHYTKITANLIPTLSTLTSGSLGLALSPDPYDADDTRPIVNIGKIIRGCHVLYFCLDSLPDSAVASALAGILLADLAAFKGQGYNFGERQRTAVFADELSNVINRPLIELLNKGAEGGVYTTCAMQTIDDLADRLGSIQAAWMALGNLNNLIALRVRESHTQEFVAGTFGKMGVQSVRVGINQGVDAHLGDFSAGYSVQITEGMEEAVPADVLGNLPDCEYFGSFSGGRLVKGRFQIVDATSGAASWS